MDQARLLLTHFARQAPMSYEALKAFLEKERPDWIRALIPRNINAPSSYWPQKILAVSTIQAVICNQIAHELGEKLDLTFGTVEGQMAHLLQYDVPTFYISKELLAAAARTDLPGDLLLDAVPFPFPAMVFMFEKGTLRHPAQGDCPYAVVSRPQKGQVFSLPLDGMRISRTAAETAVIVSTYLPEEHRAYHSSVSVVSGETIKAAYERASNIPLELPGEDSVEVEANFIERLWRLGLTLVLIMASGENLLEPGQRLKIVKSKNRFFPSMEYWSPNYLGRVYQSQTQPADREFHLRPHWRKGHLKSQLYGPNHSLRKIIWVQPYRTGNV